MQKPIENKKDFQTNDKQNSIIANMKEETFLMAKRINDLESLCNKFAETDAQSQRDLRIHENRILEMEEVVMKL